MSSLSIKHGSLFFVQVLLFWSPNSPTVLETDSSLSWKQTVIPTPKQSCSQDHLN